MRGGAIMRKGKKGYIQLVVQIGTVLLVMLGILLLGFCLMLQYSMEGAVTLAKEMQTDLLDRQRQLVDITLRQYVNSALNFAVDAEFRHLVEEDAKAAPSEASNIDILRLMNRYLENSADVVNICYVSQNGRRHNCNRPDKGDVGFGNRVGETNQRMLKRIVNTCAEESGIHYFADGYEQKYLGNVFHQAFRVQNLYTQEVYGTLILTYAQSTLLQTMTDTLQTEQRLMEMMLATDDDELMICKDKKKIGSFFQADVEYYQDEISVQHSEVGNTGLRLYSVLDLGPYVRRFRRLQASFTTGAVAIAVIYLIVAYRLMKLANSSLKTLMSGFSQMKKSGNSRPLKIVSNDEFGYLIDEFNDLSQRLKAMADAVQKSNDDKLQAIELQHKTMMKVLHGQINFHFLANMINSISAVAIANNDYRVPQLLKALTNTLRYTFENDDALTTVKREVNWLQDYLTLQQERHGKLFSSSIKVDECVLDDQLPKLLIQPFVENSIEHGFVNRSYGGLVEIRIRRFRENGLAISIKDNGQGIDASKAEEIQRLFRGEDCTSASIGISNAVKRIRLYCHEKAHLILRTGSQGTRIDIILQ